MNQIFDKLLLFIFCTIVYVQTCSSNYMILPILIAVLFSSLSIYLNGKVLQSILCLCFFVLCTYFPSFTIFLPVIIYDILFSKFHYILIFIFYILNRNIGKLDKNIIIMTILFGTLSIYLRHKTERHSQTLASLRKLKDDSRELLFIQEEKNRSILENQDYEVNIATLNERNRISKEIHDHIGHVLSRSLIQIGALLTISQEPIIKEELGALKESLSEGMDSIRASVHNMHDESIDLYNSIDDLVKNFNFCEIQFEYDVLNPPLLKVKYCFIAIVKESLSNIMKHSNATKVVIVVAEEPSLYRLIIEDNGTISDKTKMLARRVQISNEYVEGMGLQNMMERVKGFNGAFQIVAENGFKIFITIPKESYGG